MMKRFLNWIRRTLDHDLSLGYAKPVRWSCMLFVLAFALPDHIVFLDKVSNMKKNDFPKPNII